MRNSIKKRRFKPVSALKSDTSFLYNFSSIAIYAEVLIGAVLGVALCFGFVFSFFLLGGSIFVSLGIFFSILIIAVFFVFLFKYVFIATALKVKEIEILERIARQTRR